MKEGREGGREEREREGGRGGGRSWAESARKKGVSGFPTQLCGSLGLGSLKSTLPSSPPPGRAVLWPVLKSGVSGIQTWVSQVSGAVRLKMEVN